MRRSSVRVALTLILPLSAALQLPTLNGGRRAAAPPPPPSPPSPPQAELALQYGCAVGWLGLSVSSLSAARPLVNDVFGLSQITFEQCVKEPAGGIVGSLTSASGSLPLFPNESSPLRLDIAGLLEITSTLFPLEAALLVALAAGGIAAAEDRARAGVALALTSAFSLAAFGLATASGLEFEQPAAVGGAVALIAATAVLGGRAALSVAEPAALVKRDFEGLLPFGDGGEASADDADDKLAFFYRSSTLTGLLVGASFIFSPLSPIALFDTPEAPATHLFRQELGIYICFLLAPVQTALYRAAQAGELGEQTLKLLNLVAGVVVELLVLDGRAQVNLGTANFAALDKSDPFYAVLVGKLADPDAVGRASTNTTAAFSVGLLVGLIYLATALIKKPKPA